VIARVRLFGLLAAAIALAGQIALGAVILRTPAGPSEAATLASVSLFCHAGSASQRVPHHLPTAQLSALAQALAQAASLLGPAKPCLPAPSAPVLFVLRPLSPRAPPAAVRLAAQPRGPPPLT
jgi:hypothetical protein